LRMWRARFPCAGRVGHRCHVFSSVLRVGSARFRRSSCRTLATVPMGRAPSGAPSRRAAPSTSSSTTSFYNRGGSNGGRGRRLQGPPLPATCFLMRAERWTTWRRPAPRATSSTAHDWQPGLGPLYAQDASTPEAFPKTRRRLHDPQPREPGRFWKELVLPRHGLGWEPLTPYLDLEMATTSSTS
jgi:hypothetical protein